MHRIYSIWMVIKTMESIIKGIPTTSKGTNVKLYTLEFIHHFLRSNQLMLCIANIKSWATRIK
uniref:Uncharacterized protein n=1 Tax=Rhizophora mucronata TaxID=61149 RepID=A0A2P2NTW3_RHIMU